MTRHTLSWIDWADRRPLLDAPLQILQHLFGLNVSAFYLVAWLITTLAAVQLFLLIRQVRPDWRLRAWVVAALTLVFPADFSQMWLAHVLHARIGWLLTLLAASCLVTYLKRRSIGWVLAATGLSLIALLLYEAQLGVFVAFGLLLMALKRDVRWRTRLMLLIPLGVNGLYTVWRSLGFKVVGIQDQYLSELTLNIGGLLGRVGLGLQVLLWSWTEPVRRVLQFESNWLTLLIISGMLIGLMLVAMRWPREKSTATMPSLAASAKADWLTLLCGLGLLVAGYFPTILLYAPNLDSVFSRVNFYALPGAALCLSVLIEAAARQLARGDQRRWRAGFVAASVALIGLGMMVQIWVRSNATSAWQEQRTIWTQLFDLAPRFEPDTLVCIVVPDYREQMGFVNWGRMPLSASWEVGAAIRTLYDDPSLQGALIKPVAMGYGEASLSVAGVQLPNSKVSVPYSKAVFLAYDKEHRQLTILRDVPAALNLTWSLSDYNPEQRIIQGNPSVVLLRNLVSAE